MHLHEDTPEKKELCCFDHTLYGEIPFINPHCRKLTVLDGMRFKIELFETDDESMLVGITTTDPSIAREGWLNELRKTLSFLRFTSNVPMEQLRDALDEFDFSELETRRRSDGIDMKWYAFIFRGVRFKDDVRERQNRSFELI